MDERFRLEKEDILKRVRGCCGRDRMVVGLTTTY